MGFEGKHSTVSGSSSSEESDHHDQAEKFDENAVGVGRFYECMYCKRGFNNAQALGGHMNIHRKEKAKAKQQKAAGINIGWQSSSLVSSKSCEDLMRSRYDEKSFLSADEQTQYSYEVPVGGQMSYQHFFPGSNPNFDACDLVAQRKENLGLFEEHGDLNLSIQIGHAHTDLGEIRSNSTWKESSEVDLELRLGLAL